MERSYLPLSKGKISYLERQGRYPVIFLHGLGGSGNNWLRLASQLPEDIRMIMPDLCGHGKTDISMVDYSVAEQVAAMHEFVGKLGLENFAMAGNSYGGWVAMKFCLNVNGPEKLVLVDSAGINPTVGEVSPENEEKFVRRVMDMNPRNNIDNIRKFVKANATGKEKVTSDELARIRAETMIIWGRNDRLIPVEYAEKLNRGIPESTLKILENAGHTPHSTNHEEVGAILRDFLARN